MADMTVTPLQAKAILAARENLVSAIDIFRPTEQQEEVVRAMEREDVLEVLLGGGNRSGKSILASAIFTSIVLDRPITFHDGSKHFMRPEQWRGQALKIWLIAHDWNRIGQTMYRLLFKPDPFRMVRDRNTGEWRARNPAVEPLGKTKAAPPFIKLTDIVDGYDGISWENKKDCQVKAFTLIHDETRVEFFASTGATPMGDPAHYIWMDEALHDENWCSELRVRLIDHEGFMLWTSWPDTEPSDEMSAIEDRAKEQHGKQDQSSFYFVLDGDLNPYTKNKTREKVQATMDHDTLMARAHGIMNKDRWRMYPRFNKYVHRAYGPDATDDDLLAKTLRASGSVPANWTRYLILDPGTVHPAILFVAVPPPEFGDYIVPYDELSPSDTSAEPLARLAAAKAGVTKTHPGDVFEEFIADMRACRQTPLGFAGTIGQNYEKEFAKAGLRSRRHGSRFTPGSDDVDVRIALLQGAMNLRANGKPRLRIFGCEELIKQLEKYRRKKDPNKKPMDKPAEHQTIDLAVALEYFVSRDDCGYVRPIIIPPEKPDYYRNATNEITSKIFGRQNNVKEAEKTVFCGAGRP